MTKLKSNNMLFINPHHRVSVHYGVSLGLGYLASVLEEKGMHVKIIDCQVTSDYNRHIRESLKEYSLVGISVNIGTVSSALDIARLIRKNSVDTKIIMGGPHATFIYDKLIPEYADIVVRGEGEHTISELMDSKSLEEIKGIAYWDGGIKVTPKRPFIEDLDSLSIPAWHLFNLNKYYKPTGCKAAFARIITSRGCPYECIFCSRSVVHGTRQRIRSIDNIIHEIDYLVDKLKVEEIVVNDDSFNFDPERVKGICKAIIRQKYKKLHLIAIGMRSDVSDRDMFYLMRQAGFHLVRFGVESGSQDVLDKIRKRLNLKDVKKTIALARKSGMKTEACFILGLPFDTCSTMQETIDLAKELSLDKVLFSIASPFPGTELYNIVKKEGRFLRDVNFQTENRRDASFEIGCLRASDVKKMWREAYRQVYLRPGQIYRMIMKKEFKFLLSLRKEFFN